MKRLEQIWAFLTKPEVYWRVFSLLLAITFWLLAAGDGTLGGTERTVALDVEVRNLPSDLVLVDPPTSVKVRIRGLSPILNRGEDAIIAKIDLLEAKEGIETYGVEVEAPGGIEIISVMPRWVSVYAEPVSGVVFPVTLALLGVDPKAMVSGLIPSPPVVTVTGPSSILERVDHVVAYLSLGEKLTELEGSFPVQALDAQGRSLNRLEIEPSEIKIEIKVEVVSEEEQDQDPNREED